MIMTEGEIEQLAIKEALQPDTKASRGGILFRDRVKHVATKALKTYDGDLIEIGCYAGGTSCALANLARRFNRKLVCVDNWLPNTGYELDKVKKVFDKNIAPYLDVVEVLYEDAHSEETIQKIQKRQYCFALSDDGHLYKDHFSELITLMPITQVIVVDDHYYAPEVPNAIRDAMEEYPGWKKLSDDRLIEAYLIKEE